MKLKGLILTDSSAHSENNSVYSFVRQMISSQKFDSIFVANRALEENISFFQDHQFESIQAIEADESFGFDPTSQIFKTDLQTKSLSEFDFIFLRLPRPITDEFLLELQLAFIGKPIINNPKGIIQTSNKAYLLQIHKHCPPIRLCESIEDVKEFASRFPIVLKPLREYGGKGIIKIQGNQVDDGKNTIPLDDFLQEKKSFIEKEGYLAMKFLKNVKEGDKRILVVNGEALASSIRMPKKGSWLCNVAQGGVAKESQINSEEYKIIEDISPKLLQKGIVIYGLDTLVNDEGKRVVSEINTLSIGGFPQAEEFTGRPIIKTTIDHIYNYVHEHKRSKNN